MKMQCNQTSWSYTLHIEYVHLVHGGFSKIIRVETVMVYNSNPIKKVRLSVKSK